MTVFESTLNENYFIGACVTLNTLKRYAGTDIPYNIFLFESFSTEKKDILNGIYPNIIFRNITDSVYKKYKLSTEFRNWGYNVYNRFEIFTLKATKIIFFDFDLLFLGNIDELVNNNSDFSAVIRYKDNLSDYFFDDCFDAGVMVIGEKFINENIKHELLKISQQRDWSSDEPVLNYFFNKSLTPLQKKYNVLTPQYTEYKDDARIVQFIGKKKPWCQGKLIDKYDDFVLQANSNIIDLIRLEIIYGRELIRK